MDYNDWLQRLLKATSTGTYDTELLDYQGQIIDQAEQRCYRELDLLNTVVRDSSTLVTPSNRDFTLPQSLGRFVVVNGVNLITPVGFTTSNGSRNALLPISLQALDVLYPSNAAIAGVLTTYYAPVTDQTIALGPAPAAAYQAEVVGTIRPIPLSDTNTTTFLTLYLPDLFFAASMVAAVGYQRDFGAQSDDPKMGLSWEQQYQTAFQSANLEEMRRKYASAGWTSASPAPIAQAPR